MNFDPLAAEIGPVVWGTPANFNGFHVLAALLHGTLVKGVSQTLRRSTEGATFIRQGGHHVGHWPTFLVLMEFTCQPHETVHMTLYAYQKVQTVWIADNIACYTVFMKTVKPNKQADLNVKSCETHRCQVIGLLWQTTGSYFRSNLAYVSKLIQLNFTGRIFSRKT